MDPITLGDTFDWVNSFGDGVASDKKSGITVDLALGVSVAEVTVGFTLLC